MNRWLQRAGHLGFDLFDGAAHSASRLVRRQSPEVEVLRDLPFLGTGEPAHTLDLFRPRRPGPHPVVLYVHGGAFFSLSKDTHWSIAMTFAQKGYLVCNINYRLAPAHRFPAALMDCIAAWGWLVDKGPSFDGDLKRVVLAGESAGANLILALALCISTRRDEPWAQPAFELGVVPRAILPFCGLLDATGLQESRPARQPLWYRSMRALLRDYASSTDGASRELLDPLRLFENGALLERPLPPFFIAVGALDPLVEDSQRLAVALRRRAVVVEARSYPGEGHAFQLLPWRGQAGECWRNAFAFLETHGLLGN
jgi:acetyl esterase